MRGLLRGSVATWALLVAVTLGGWLLTEDSPWARIGASTVIVIAGFKVTLVIARFMEVSWQPRPWRIVLSFWTAGVMSIILGGYWIAVLRG